jgi:hypothetical protein
MDLNLHLEMDLSHLSHQVQFLLTQVIANLKIKTAVNILTLQALNLILMALTHHLLVEPKDSLARLFPNLLLFLSVDKA